MLRAFRLSQRGGRCMLLNWFSDDFDKLILFYYFHDGEETAKRLIQAKLHCSNKEARRTLYEVLLGKKQEEYRKELLRKFKSLDVRKSQMKLFLETGILLPRKPLRKQKLRVALFVDGENISHKHAERIRSIAEKEGIVVVSRVYTLYNDPSIRKWREKAKDNQMVDVRLGGKHEKDKVDRKIQSDMRRLFDSRIDVICLATCDGGYAPTVQAAVSAGKRVIVMGEEVKMSARLRKAGSRMVAL